MAAKKERKSLPVWAFGLIALVLALVAVFIFVPVDNTYAGGEHWGWKAGTFWFWKSFLYEVPSMFRSEAFTQGIIYISIAFGIYVLILGIMKKEKKLMLDALLIVLTGFVTGYIVTVFGVGIAGGFMNRKGMVGCVLGIILGIFALLVLVFDANGVNGGLVKNPNAEEEKPAVAAVDEEKVREIVRDELAKEEKAPEGVSEEKVNAIVDEKALDEEEVREIVRDELSKHEPVAAAPVEEAPAEPEAEEEPVKEEEPVAEAAEEEEEGAEAEAPAEGAAEEPAGKFPNSRRRGASFETKLKNSEYDLRHKYYDLRDYIKSYGINNRISRPGDTFSLHREKLVFLTISGKHIKASFALNPEDYKDSAIPVDVNTSKRLEDLPLAFKVKSDLSFRRAKKLVDDVMAIKGYTREEEKK